MFRLVQTSEGEKYKSNWLISPEYKEWDIGMIVLKNHDFLFNYEGYKVSFVNNSKLEYKSSSFLYILIGVSLALLIGIGAGVGFYLYKRNLCKEKEDLTASFLHGDIIPTDNKTGEKVIKNSKLISNNRVEEDNQSNQNNYEYEDKDDLD